MRRLSPLIVCACLVSLVRSGARAYLCVSGLSAFFFTSGGRLSAVCPTCVPPRMPLRCVPLPAWWLAVSVSVNRERADVVHIYPFLRLSAQGCLGRSSRVCRIGKEEGFAKFGESFFLFTTLTQTLTRRRSEGALPGRQTWDMGQHPY
eukprot:scaffold59488_cov33-Tisochrysis_lutea.AAC.1